MRLETIRWYLIPALLLVSAVAVVAQEPPKAATLAEVDLLRLEKITSDRATLDERFKRLSLEAQMVVNDWNAKGREYDALVAAEATKAGLDPKAFTLDLATKSWKKK